MQRFRCHVCVAALVLLYPIHASGQSADALIVLTTVGFLVGAADKVVPAESNAAASGLGIAISGGNYGDPAQALALFNNARQKGAAEAAEKRLDCDRVGQKLRNFVEGRLKR